MVWHISWTSSFLCLQVRLYQCTSSFCTSLSRQTHKLMIKCSTPEWWPNMLFYSICKSTGGRPHRQRVENLLVSTIPSQDKDFHLFLLLWNFVRISPISTLCCNIGRSFLVDSIVDLTPTSYTMNSKKALPRCRLAKFSRPSARSLNHIFWDWFCSWAWWRPRRNLPNTRKHRLPWFLPQLRDRKRDWQFQQYIQHW